MKNKLYDKIHAAVYEAETEAWKDTGFEYAVILEEDGETVRVDRQEPGWKAEDVFCGSAKVLHKAYHNACENVLDEADSQYLFEYIENLITDDEYDDLYQFVEDGGEVTPSMIEEIYPDAYREIVTDHIQMWVDCCRIMVYDDDDDNGITVSVDFVP